MEKSALILLAPGFEDIEAIAVIDILRRADVAVTTASVTEDGSLPVISSHGVCMLADTRVASCLGQQYDLVYLPGGMPGTANLALSQDVKNLVNKELENQGVVAAICAAPIALDAAGVLDGVKYTCYPGCEKQISNGEYTGARIQISGAIITGCGPGVAAEMAFELLRALGLADKAASIAASMQMKF